jgi:hypothetical protein
MEKMIAFIRNGSSREEGRTAGFVVGECDKRKDYLDK